MGKDSRSHEGKQNFPLTHVQRHYRCSEEGEFLHLGSTTMDIISTMAVSDPKWHMGS